MIGGNKDFIPLFISAGRTDLVARAQECRPYREETMHRLAVQIFPRNHRESVLLVDANCSFGKTVVFRHDARHAAH